MEKKILVVDNHPMVLRLISNLLEKDGHTVRTAEDGLQALDVLKTFVPDIIFVDLVMPNISGEKLCRIIRNMPHLADAFLVILSAIAAEEELDFDELGADACIAKGALDSLAKHIHRVLELSGEPANRQHEALDIMGLDEVSRREITRELLSSRKHFEVILNHMSEGIMEFTHDLKIIYANPAALLLVGVAEERLLGTDFFDIFGNHSRELALRQLEKNIPAAKTNGEDVSIILNGRRISLHFLPVEDAGSTIVIIHDITKRKRAEEKIRDQNKFLSGLLESLPHPFFVVAVDTRQVLHANTAARQKVLHLDEHAITKKRFPAPGPALPYEKVTASGQSFVMEYVDGENGDGERIYEIHSHPIFDKQDRVSQIIQYRFDITERHRAAQKLEASKEELQQALDNLKVAQAVAIRQEKLASIGTLASGVAHEILNPLNIIGTLAQVLQLEEIPEGMKKSLDEVLVQIKRATRITNSLRTFSHQHDFELRRVDVNSLFDKTAMLLEHDLTLDNIHIERDFASDLPAIEADEDQLAQVFLNLLNNARDAMADSDKRIVIKTRVRNGGIEIVFADTGTGIAHTDLNKIFDPFFTTKDPGHGTGLGLWIVYSIIENHGGTIEVDSAAGAGSRFTITLPCSQAGQGARGMN